MKKERVFIVFDGSNFYYKLKSLGFKHLLGFDYQRFIGWLARGKRVSSSCFYTGQVREEPGNEKSKQLKKDQDKLLARLRNTKLIVKTGYILKSDGEYHEKGVDVQIAIDICMKAVRNEYDRLILVSSDTDLIPAIKEIKNLRKKVEYVGFENNPSFALIRFSDFRTLLKKEDIKPYVKS